MGCDIHPYMEIRFEEDDWIFFGELTEYRNYTVFARLSGCRGSDPQEFENALDLPEDVCEEIAKRWERGKLDWHSLTVIDGHDIIAFAKKHDGRVMYEGKRMGFKESYFVENWAKVADALYKAGVVEIRVILWYDN